MPNSRDYTFLPWVRSGLGQDLQLSNEALLAKARRNETLTPDDITIPVTMGLVEQPSNRRADNLALNVRMFGPGEVTGIDGRQVIRTEPAANSTNVEPNYFPVVEFDRPDFPWLFSPACASGEQLTPWICLVTVKKQDGILQPPSETMPLPVLKIQTPAKELPDPSELWAWAHAQITGSYSSLGEALTRWPEKNCSRLLCPRRLEPRTTYLACVVPVFEVGCLAGLRKDLSLAKGVFAWCEEDTTNQRLIYKSGPLDIPVYYFWEFSTGDEGDFEALLKRMSRNSELGDLGVGKRPMQLTPASSGLDPVANLWLEGALTAFEAETPAPSDSTADLERCKRALEPVVNPALLGPGQEDVVCPPLYGRWHAGFMLKRRGLDQIPWLRDLNLDPRWRAVASLGTQVVQDQQEHLMASAWDQIGEVQKANQLLRQAQLARASTERAYTNDLLPLDDANLILLTSPAHTRLTRREDNGGETLHAALRPPHCTVPGGALGAAFRRMTRSRGRLARRGGKSMRWGAELLVTLNSGQFATTGPLDTHDDQLKATLPDDAPPIPGQVGQEAYEPRRLIFSKYRTWITEGLDPDITIPKHWQHPRIVRPAGWPPDDDQLEPIMAAPSFPQPMYRALRDISQEYFLPGLSKVPPETIAALYTNTRFVEAFIVGLNHEMGRELLWRGYPTDQRGSYFRQFWDTSSQIFQEVPEPDMEPMHTWLRSELGTHLKAHRGSNTGYLFSLSITAAADLDGHRVPAQLEAQLEQHGITLTAQAYVRVTMPGFFWAVIDGDAMYDMRNENKLINVYHRSRDERESRIVLLLRGTLLARYPRTLIYLAKAEQDTATGKRRPAQSTTTLSVEQSADFFRNTRLFPIFQGSLAPDITFLGFDLTPAEAYGDRQAHKPGWFFIFQQPPTELRFGLDATAPTVAEERQDWGDLSWEHVKTGTDNPYIQLGSLNASPVLHLDNEARVPLTWDKLDSAAQFAAVTSQRPALIAIHASDLLTPPV